MERGASRPPAFVHVDLDGLWTLPAAYGYPEKNDFDDDVVFTRGLDRLLALFDRRGLRATFFIVGRDLEHPAKAEAVGRIAAAGHELANHGYSHWLDLDSQPEATAREEIERTSDALEAIAGRRPIGFRAPGYAAGPRLLAVCSAAGLRYDGSCLPTRWASVLNRLAESIRRGVRRELGAEARAVDAPNQYGGAPANPADPLAPGWWRPPAGGRPLLRLPLAVSPRLGLPLHASLGIMLGARRVRGGLSRLARRGHPVTWLLHGLDLVGGEDLAGRLPATLARMRAFRLPLAARQAFIEEVLDALQALTEIQLTADWLERQTPPQDEA